MIEGNPVFPLEKIALGYSLILIDNSFLSCSLTNTENLSIREKTNLLKKQYEFRTLLTNYLKKGYSYFITTLVFEECSSRYYHYKKIIKRKGSPDRELLKLMRQIGDSEKEKRKLVNIFQEEGRILQLDKEEQHLYDILSERYSSFKTMDECELNDVNFDYFISGAVVSKTRNSSALASNNFKIVHAWNHFRKKENIPSKQFGFFVRKEINRCWKLGQNKRCWI